MKKTSLNIIETLGFDEKLLEKIKHFLGLTKEDEHCLQSLHDTVIAWYEKDFTHAFYEHLLAFEDTSNILSGYDIEILKEKQGAYFLEMFSGCYDLVYARRRIEMALTHANIGLKSSWYLGAFSNYLLILWPKIAEIYEKDPQKLLQIHNALQKVMFLDLIIAADTYAKLDEKTVYDLTIMRDFAQGILAQLPAGIIVLDRQSKIVFANNKASEFLGKDIVEGQNIHDFLDLPALDTHIQYVLEGGRPPSGILYQTPNKKVLAVCAASAQAEAEGVLLVLEDVSEYFKAKKEAALISKLADETPDAIVIMSPNGEVFYANQAAKAYFGDIHQTFLLTEFQERDEAAKIENDVLPILQEKNSWVGESIFLDQKGQRFPVTETILAHRNRQGNIIYYSIALRNIADIKNLEQSLAYFKYHDPLTNLPNRALFKEKLHQLITPRQAYGKLVAILLIDIDDFRRFNEVMGYDLGDIILKHIATRLQQTLRHRDFVARVGGDEFGVILPGITQTDHILYVIQKILQILSQPFGVDGLASLALRCKIGISIYPDDGEDSEILIRRAEAALNTAKKKEGLAFSFYSPAMDQEARARLALEQELLWAIQERQFKLFYQPQVDTVTAKIVSFEALLRWHHPQKGLISPAHFIPALEETGLIKEVGSWVIEEACRQIAQWRRQGLPFDYIGINASAHQFAEGNLDTLIIAALDDFHLEAKTLVVEVTESAIMADLPKALAMMDRMRGKDIHIALDDFGTGYSSLAQLHDLPINIVKIDRAFVKGLPEDRYGRSIIRAVLSICEELQLDAIAEGVETIAQKDYLVTQHCPKFQGYLVSPPVPPDQIEKLMKTVS